MSSGTRSALTTVLQTIRQHSPVSRASLTRMTGLSPSVVSTSTKQLLERGLLEEHGTHQDTLGRPQVLLKINPSHAVAIGMALTWSGLHAVMTDLEGTVLASHTVPLVSDAPDQVIAQCVAEMAELRKQHKVRNKDIAGVGLALPGWIDSETGTCLKSTVHGWNGVPFRPLLEEALGYPAFVENDANALAVGEKWFGLARHFENYAVVTLVDGIGAGIYTYDQLYRGSRGATGEFGHINIAIGGPACTCGKRGCLEALASIPALLQQAASAGLPSDLHGLTTAAEAGNLEAQAVFETAGRYIGYALSTLNHILDLQAIIITAPADYLNPYLKAALETSYRDNSVLFADTRMDILYQEEDSDIWALGAASLAIQAFYERGGVIR